MRVYFIYIGKINNINDNMQNFYQFLYKYIIINFFYKTSIPYGTEFHRGSIRKNNLIVRLQP